MSRTSKGRTTTGSPCADSAWAESLTLTHQNINETGWVPECQFINLQKEILAQTRTFMLGWLLGSYHAIYSKCWQEEEFFSLGLGDCPSWPAFSFPFLLPIGFSLKYNSGVIKSHPQAHNVLNTCCKSVCPIRRDTTGWLFYSPNLVFFLLTRKQRLLRNALYFYDRILSNVIWKITALNVLFNILLNVIFHDSYKYNSNTYFI